MKYHVDVVIITTHCLTNTYEVEAENETEAIQKYGHSKIILQHSSEEQETEVTDWRQV